MARRFICSVMQERERDRPNFLTTTIANSKQIEKVKIQIKAGEIKYFAKKSKGQ